jgi:hypothetical protein
MYITGGKGITPVWLKVPADATGTKTIRNMFGEGNELSLTVRPQASCCTSKSCQGKNFNYFVANETVFVETSPMAPHIVEQVDVDHKCKKSTLKQVDTSVRTNEIPDQPSFFSNMERYFAMHGYYTSGGSRNRGTAGFVEIRVPDERTGRALTLLVGVSQ